MDSNSNRKSIKSKKKIGFEFESKFFKNSNQYFLKNSNRNNITLPYIVLLGEKIVTVK